MKIYMRAVFLSVFMLQIKKAMRNATKLGLDPGRTHEREHAIAVSRGGGGAG